MQGIIQNNMSVATSVAERVYRYSAETFLGPKCWFNGELEVPLVEYLRCRLSNFVMLNTGLII
jgi:hypothetical protein